MNANTRAAKRTKLNPSVQNTKKYNTADSDSKLITVLNIADNSTIMDITNYRNLTVLNLDETDVQSIEQCPSLFMLDINSNSKIKKLQLPSVKKVCLKDLSGLYELELSTAITVHLENIPVLQNLYLPLATDVTLSNLRIDQFEISESIPRVQTLSLINVRDINLDYLDGMSITKLILDNCDITHLGNLDSFEEITLKNCQYLSSVYNIANVDNLNIFNCGKLFNIDTIDNISDMTISQCGTLSRIKNIDATKLSIRYCFSILEVLNFSLERLEIEYCPSIECVSVSSDLKHLVINDCRSFEKLLFNSISAFDFEDLEIELTGDNLVEVIKDWYVAKLTITNNRSLESIANLYNIVNLIIQNCIELQSISNAFIAETICLENCPSLETIRNVYGFQTLSITHCESLTDFDSFGLSKLKFIHILSCPELNLRFDGSLLTHLGLYDTGSVFIQNLSKRSSIDICNVPFLPNITTSLFDIDLRLEDENPIFPEAIEVANCMRTLLDATQVIKNHIRAYRIRQKYLKYQTMKERDQIIDCVICHDSIDPIGWTITSCDHLFHSPCLSRWFEVRRTCPLCNNAL